MLQQTAKRLQLDRPLAFALAARVWQAVAGPITIALVIRFMNEDETGIYYNFAPIIGIQAFFELGLLNVLISQAGLAHSACQAEEETDRDLAAGRMGELIRASRNWFGFASIAFALAAIAFGWYTFSQTDVDVPWQYPLLVIAPLAAITVFFSPSLAILEGAGQRDLIYRFRFYQMLCGSLAVWIALMLGWGVWAIVLATFVQTVWTAYLAMVHRGEFFSKFIAVPAQESFSWMRDVMPLQWRVAANGLAFHLATQFLAVCVITYHGAAESGRLGMTLSITMAIQMMAMAWVQTKYPVISNLHGSGSREEAGTLWKRTTVISSSLLCLGFAGLLVGLFGLSLFGRGWESRFIDPMHVVYLGVGCLANHLVAIQAFYVLARGAKPFVFATVVGYLTTAALVWAGGYYWSIAGVVTGFAIGLTFVALPLHTWFYLRFRA